MIDRHHLVRAVWEADVPNKVYVTVKRDLSHESLESFWNVLISEQWTYLKKEGNSHEISHLPTHIKDMEDDPFRSLSWVVRENHGYHKGAFFSEFIWADYLRTKFQRFVLYLNFRSQVEGAKMWEVVNQAVTLCRSHEAKGLPGYVE